MLSINNTTEGYLKNVEIKGNTIQDANNLADIKSTGDKIEGQDLYEIPLLSVGKNLFDGELELGSLGNVGEDIVSTSRNRTKNKIKVMPGAKYVLSASKSGLVFDICFYDSSMVFISKVPGVSFSTPTNCKYIRFNSREVLTGIKIQLEEGTQATPCEPYQEHKLTILSPVQLEKGDVLKEVDGVWGVEKNIETNYSPITNSALTQVDNSSISDTVLRFAFSNSINAKNKIDLICNRFKTINYSSTSQLIDECAFIHSSLTRVDVCISKSKLSAPTIDGFREWEKNNGLIFKYLTSVPQFIPLPHSQQVKLRTFANRTNISFLCETEGTIKADVPKSLGATVNTHTTQIDSLNQELERVKKLEESTVSTVVTESDFTVVEQTTNGYFEDVELSGRTEVNLCTDKLANNDRYRLLNLIKVVKGNSSIIFKAIPTNYNKVVYSEITFTDDTSLEYNFGIISNNIITHNMNFDKDIKRIAIKIPNSDYNNGSRLETSEFVIIEGDHTQNPPPYFEGLTSVGDGTNEIVVSSVDGDGNLFDGELERGYIINGVPTGSGYQEYIRSKNYIRVNSDTLKSSFNQDSSVYGGVAIVSCYDTNCNFLGTRTTVQLNASDKLINGTVYIKVIIKSVVNPAPLSNWSLYLNSNIDNIHKPHKTDKKKLLYFDPADSTWKKPIIDEFSTVKKGSDGVYRYYKRGEKVVLNGSENIKLDNGASSQVDTIAFVIPVSNSKDDDNINVICDKFKGTNGTTTATQDLEGISCRWKQLGLRISKNKLTTQDVAGFKAWLQANNVTVVYQLAQEQVYECTNIDLITYPNETNFTVKSGVLSPKSTLKVHSNISNVVKILQEKVDLNEDRIMGLIQNINPVLDTTSIVGNKLNLTLDKYQFANMVNSTQIVLPTVNNFAEIHLFFNATTALTLVFPSGVKWQTVPTIKANCNYEFIFTYVNGVWLGGYLVHQ